MGLRRILRVQQGFYAFQRHTVLSGGIFRSGLFSCQQFVAAYAQRAGQLLQIIQPGQRSAALPFADGLTGDAHLFGQSLLGKACRPAQRKNAFVDRHSCVLLRKSEAGTGPPSDFILTKVRARGHQLGVPFRQPAVAGCYFPAWNPMEQDTINPHKIKVCFVWRGIPFHALVLHKGKK